MPMRLIFFLNTGEEVCRSSKDTVDKVVLGLKLQFPGMVLVNFSMLICFFVFLQCETCTHH